MTVRRRSHELYVLKADGSIGQVIPVVAEEDPMVLAAGEAQRLGVWVELWSAGQLVGRFQPNPKAAGEGQRETRLIAGPKSRRFLK